MCSPHLARTDEELPRVLMSEKNFEIWIEDVQALRPDALRGDLAALQAGSLSVAAALQWEPLKAGQRAQMRNSAVPATAEGELAGHG
ncbi:hypothetical protein AK812_SmicGene6096 [Symbiodinium microadriaticum]|uniref:Uncharacterized protein n=1 Tax=Symbiodinium microadriaticum TaxID=2951 RepID=A0A1Q9ES31_SYMMI|nr:hypothetical protein AK812_SmicGene6096 [Symbiodinium microadriaticum]